MNRDTIVRDTRLPITPQSVQCQLCLPCSKKSLEKINFVAQGSNFVVNTQPRRNTLAHSKKTGVYLRAYVVQSAGGPLLN